MWKRFTAENTRNWIDMLPKLINEYNNSYHSTVGMSPNNAIKPENYNTALENTLSKTNKFIKHNAKYKIGDKVRISRIKGIFEKGYLPNWSEAVYLIHKVKNTNPITYILKDELGEILEGGFYENELQKTNQEVYRIENVIRKNRINGQDYTIKTTF